MTSVKTVGQSSMSGGLFVQVDLNRSSDGVSHTYRCLWQKSFRLLVPERDIFPRVFHVPQSELVRNVRAHVTFFCYSCIYTSIYVIDGTNQ